MNDIIAMFTPYMYMFTFLISISVTLFALFKGVGWVNILILNIIVSVAFNFMGLGGYDLLTNIVVYIADILATLVGALVDAIGKLFEAIGKIFDFGWF